MTGMNNVREERLEPVCDQPTEKLESKQSLLTNYEINIRFLSVGCVISVGCKSVPFQSNKEAMEALTKYVANPLEERNKWYRIFNSVE